MRRPSASITIGVIANSFFALHHLYSLRPNPAGVVDEFRDMLEGAPTAAGIEVILDHSLLSRQAGNNEITAFSNFQ